MGPLKRKTILVGRVRVSKWGWSRAMGPLKRKTTRVGRARVFKWGWSMAMGPLRRLLKRKKILAWRVRVFR